MRILHILFRACFFAIFIVSVICVIGFFTETYPYHRMLRGCEKSFFAAISLALADPGFIHEFISGIVSLAMLIINKKEFHSSLSFVASILCISFIVAMHIPTVENAIFFLERENYPDNCYPIYEDSLWISENDLVKLYPSGDGQTAYLQYQIDGNQEQLIVEFHMGVCYVRSSGKNYQEDFFRAMSAGKAEIWNGIFGPKRFVIYRNMQDTIPELDYLFSDSGIAIFHRVK